MNKYKIGSHTADKTIIAESDTLDGLFQSAMDGLASLLIPDNLILKEKKQVSTKIKIESIDQSCLIVDFLSEILSYSYIKKSIFLKSEFDYLTKNSLSATIYGYKVDRFKEDIKAITYYGAKLRFLNGKFKIKILIDI